MAAGDSLCSIATNNYHWDMNAHVKEKDALQALNCCVLDERMCVFKGHGPRPPIQKGPKPTHFKPGFEMRRFCTFCLFFLDRGA